MSSLWDAAEAGEHRGKVERRRGLMSAVRFLGIG